MKMIVCQVTDQKICTEFSTSTFLATIINSISFSCFINHCYNSITMYLFGNFIDPIIF